LISPDGFPGKGIRRGGWTSAAFGGGSPAELVKSINDPTGPVPDPRDYRRSGPDLRRVRAAARASRLPAVPGRGADRRPAACRTQGPVLPLPLYWLRQELCRQGIEVVGPGKTEKV